jgi:dTDP-glucose pyrophosphorylase
MSWTITPILKIPRLCVPATISLAKAMARLNETAMQVLFVMSNDGRLLGTLTDGDIRRAIVGGRSLDGTIKGVFNAQPRCVTRGTEAADLERLRNAGITAAPVVDANTSLTDFAKFLLPNRRTAVVLVGGRGSRLGTLTEATPKPLLEVGGQPILGHLFTNLAQSKFSTVYLAVHHMAEQIVAYAEAACPTGLELRFIRESSPLGTAGALGHLPEDLSDPLLVLNGDLVTRTSFGAVMDYHADHGRAVTIGCAQYRHQIPFGVIEMSGDAVARIVEKPTITRFVSAGIHVVSPMAFRMVPRNEALDMPQLINMALEAGLGAVTFPVVEYWIDIGRPAELARAREEWSAA